MFFSDEVKDEFLEIACKEDFIGCDALRSLWDEIYTKTSVSATEIAIHFYSIGFQKAVIELMNSVNDFDEGSDTFKFKHTPFSEEDANEIKRQFELIE